MALAYDKYLTTYTYFFVGEIPSSYVKALRLQNPFSERLNMGNGNYLKPFTWPLMTGTEQWHHIIWEEDGEKRFGFIHGSDATERLYQFDKMEEAVKKAEAYAERGELTYISNYQNRNGYAPLYKGKTVDDKGNRRSQSAPGYPSLSHKEDFIYLGDGTLVRYLFPSEDYARVEVVASGGGITCLKCIPKDHRIRP